MTKDVLLSWAEYYHESNVEVLMWIFLFRWAGWDEKGYV